MAQHQVDPSVDLGFTDKQRAVAGSAAVTDESVASVALYASNDDLDAEVIAEYGYTQAEVDKMTQNDKIYAVRLANDSDTF